MPADGDKPLGDSFDRSLPPRMLLISLVLLAVAFVLLASQLASIHEEVYHGYAESKAYADAEERFRNECIGLAAVQELIECFDRIIESSREPQRAEEDLYAQKQMAHWAEWMTYATAFIGIVSIAVAIWGVVLIRGTFDLQRAATAEASKATQAAVEAVEINRQAYIADQRPWVAVDLEIAGPFQSASEMNRTLASTLWLSRRFLKADR